MWASYIYALVRAKSLGVISSAKADLIIPWINALRSAIIPSYFVTQISIAGSCFFTAGCVVNMIPLHFPFSFVFAPFLVSQIGSPPERPSIKEWKDFVEELGGDGPKVAAYLRVSKKKRDSYSLEFQYEAINKMKAQYQPSRIYWFIDDGKSSKSPKDFDKLKMNDISVLREKREIQELWVFLVNRMGRVCRKLLFFFLEFCDEGGVIRDSQKTYDLKDLGGIITFVIEAHSAEKANTDRATAATAGKARAFKLKRWNKKGGKKGERPFGFAPFGEWLKKLPEYGPLINRLCQLLFETRNLKVVSDQLGTFGGLLAKPLSTSQIKRIATDPLYKGEPEHLGEVVIDSDLAFYDKDIRERNLEALAYIQKRWKPKRVGPLMQLAISKPTTFQQLLEDHEIEMRHTRCGGLVRLNGTTFDESIWQQLLSCKQCPKKWRLPPVKNNSHPEEKNTMGGLNYDKGSNVTIEKEPKRRKIKRIVNQKSRTASGLCKLSAVKGNKCRSVDLAGNNFNSRLQRPRNKKRKQNTQTKSSAKDSEKNERLDKFRNEENENN